MRPTKVESQDVWLSKHDMHLILNLTADVLTLQGIVVDTSRLRMETHIVGAARSQGLQVMTYGLGNNDPSWVQQQGRLGVAAAIVDDVDAIAPLATASNILPSSFRHMSSIDLKAPPAPMLALEGLEASQLPAVLFSAVPSRAAVKQLN